MKGLIGRKVGMTQVYDESGRIVPVTVVQAGPCTVLDVKTQSRDGYSALQLGFGDRKAKNVGKAVSSHCAKAGLSDIMPSVIREVRTDGDSEVKPGAVLNADVFAENDLLDVTGITKGRGFQGVIKRFKFSGGRGSHGSKWTRRAGSIGACAAPGNVAKGRKMPGRMGGVRRTVQNLQVVRVMAEDNVLLVKGAIPGPNGGTVIIREAIKAKGK